MFQFHSRFSRIVIALVFLLAVGGIFIGQDKPKELPKPGVVYAPAETPNPARDQLVRQLIHYRTVGDVENAQKIIDILSPSSGGQDAPPSYLPNFRLLGKDEIGTDGPGSQWSGTDAPIMNSLNHEKNPTIIPIDDMALMPKIIAIAERWNGIYAPSVLEIAKSTYHGQNWDIDGFISSTYPLTWPRMTQVTNSQYGVVFEFQKSSTDYDLWFGSLTHNPPLTGTFSGVDTSTDHTIHPAITSDYRDFPGNAYLYVVYYKVTGGGTSGQLIFRRSVDGGATWGGPVVLTTIPTLGNSPYCSITYSQNTLFVAYTFKPATTDIAVVKSADFGNTWSSPTTIAGSGSEDLNPDITAATANYAFVVYEHEWGFTDHDINYAYTSNGGTTWATGNVLDFSGYDDRFPTIKAFTYGGATKVYAAYARPNQNMTILREAQAYTLPTGWDAQVSVKNSANTTSSIDPCLIVPKFTPGGTVGAGVAWCELLGGQYNFSFNASWLPTPVFLPTLTTKAATSITPSSAMTGGIITSDGGAAVSDRGVCVSTALNPTIANAHTHDGTGAGDFVTSLTGCTPGQTYHIRAYGTNSAGTAYGGDLTFTTGAAAIPPTVTTTAISSVTKTSAMAGGNVTSAGSAAVTNRGVCVSTAPNPTIADAHTHDGAGVGAFTSTLTGCTPGETYHVRAYATNAAGTAYGSDIWFRALGGSKSDFNADGQSDILWRNITTGENAVWFMGYTATGVTDLQMKGIQNMFPGASPVPETGNLFKGKPSIVYRNPREGIENANPTSPTTISGSPMGAQGLEMRPLTSLSPFSGGITILGLTRTSVASLPSMVDFNWQLVGTGDFNGDGWPDIVWRNKVTGENGIWYFVSGTRIGTDYMPSVLDLNWKIVGTGDFNGDKKPDIVWRNSATGENFIWFMNGAARIGGDTPPSVTDPNWTIVGTGDFNGDGKPDFLWHNAVTGENYIWFMDGAMKIGGDLPPMVSDVNWQIGGVDDFNADGRPDILWRNYVSGENGVWYMNGASRIGTEYVPTIADVAWKIVNR